MATLSDLKTALDATGYPFAHHAWSNNPSGTYGVYAEDGATAIQADNHTIGQAIEGTIDLYTKDDSSTPLSTIQDKLDGLGIPWYLNSVQFENDTGLIHYEWVFTVGV